MITDGTDLARFFALMAFYACRNMDPDVYIPLRTDIKITPPATEVGKGVKPFSFTRFQVSGEVISPTSCGTICFSAEICMRPLENSEFVWVIETGDEESGTLKKYFIDINGETHPFFFSYNPHRGGINVWPVVIFPDYRGSEHSSREVVSYNIFGERGPSDSLPD